MNMLKMYKCICALIKCSKCLYFLKKAVCTLTIMLTAGSVIYFFLDKKRKKELMEKVKAVM